MAKMKELVGVGVRRVPEMQRHLKHYVTNGLFGNTNVPPLTDARFWPSSGTITNCIYKTSTQLRYATFKCVLSVRKLNRSAIAEVGVHASVDESTVSVQVIKQQ